MGLSSAKQGEAGADPAAQGSVCAGRFEGPALPEVYLYCGGWGHHHLSPEVLSSVSYFFH